MMTAQPELFDTLGAAEDVLKARGFRLVPGSCDWIDDRGVDAGIYTVDGAYGVSKYRIEIEPPHPLIDGPLAPLARRVR
jgi:hypothetical protein